MTDEMLKFLCGEGPLDGVWFGDPHPTYPGRFWWRALLREQSARPEEGLAEWISPEPTQAMLDSVNTILQPYAAKLVWARMLKAALRGSVEKAVGNL